MHDSIKNWMNGIVYTSEMPVWSVLMALHTRVIGVRSVFEQPII